MSLYDETCLTQQELEMSYMQKLSPEVFFVKRYF